ncbi:hypothetical protein JB92DRAFT_2960610 [Gautieria morchelliformis]|nr:hypothetical protein JB92DRAFT_2960610 [Gautieria morchelliformis]
MISRWRSPTLTRSIAQSVSACFPDYPVTGGALPITARDALSRMCEGKGKEKTLEGPSLNSSTDPWAPIFDDISTDAPPAHSTRSNLPPRFFNSRPSPKTYFSSNTSRGPSGRRDYGTDAGAHSSDNHSPTSKEQTDRVSAWDQIFEGVDSEPVVDGSRRRSGLMSSTFSSPRRPKRSRPTMTAREISAFDKMFDMIFTAVSDKRRESFTTAAVQVQPASRQPQSDHSEPEPSSLAGTETHLDSGSESVTSASTQVGLPSPGEVFDLFGRLRRQSNRMRQTSATAERLDRQKEEVELCETDQQLLEWTVREVFHGDHIPEPALSSSPPPSSSSPSTPNSEEIARYIANPTYPHLLAHVMHTFRVKYNDPHTALALFAHAKRRSIHSYVFGCTTPAYNELLETRWELDGALKGIEEALVEMRANGVRPDKVTRALVERVRREVGEKFLSRTGIETDGEVWEALERVEALVASKRKSDRGGAGGSDRYTKLQAKKRHWEEEWKADEAETFKLGEDRLTLA